MKQYRVIALGRGGQRVVVLDGASKSVAKATARGCRKTWDNAKVQERTVTDWKDV